jgi:hypothetical protein
VIRGSAERSRDRLGMARLDLLKAHIEDPAVPLAETVEAFAALVAEGTVGPRRRAMDCGLPPDHYLRTRRPGSPTTTQKAAGR